MAARKEPYAGWSDERLSSAGWDVVSGWLSAAGCGCRRPSGVGGGGGGVRMPGGGGGGGGSGNSLALAMDSPQCAQLHVSTRNPATRLDAEATRQIVAVR